MRDRSSCLKTNAAEARRSKRRRSCRPLQAEASRGADARRRCRGSRGAAQNQATAERRNAVQRRQPGVGRAVAASRRKPSAGADAKLPAEEPKPILLWRPGRFDRRPRCEAHGRSRRAAARRAASAQPHRSARPAAAARDERQRGRPAARAAATPREAERAAQAEVRPQRAASATAASRAGRSRHRPRRRTGATADGRDSEGQAAGQPAGPSRPSRPSRARSGRRASIRIRPSPSSPRCATSCRRSSRWPEGRQRIDKWLFFARVVKSRSLAAKLAQAGRVRINRRQDRRRPPTSVKPGDVLTITLERRILVYKVLDAGARRGPAEEARTLYEDLTPPPAPKASACPTRSPRCAMPAAAGRPRGSAATPTGCAATTRPRSRP